MRTFHAHELKGKDKQVMVYTRRNRKKKGDSISSSKASEEEKSVRDKSIEKMEDSQDEENRSEGERKDESQERPKIPCEYCSNIYSHKTALIKHKRNVHRNELTEEDKKILVIKKRQKRENLKIRLSKRNPKEDIYSRVHSKMCMFCWEEFETEEIRDAHQKTHRTAERPYLCPRADCRADFKDRNSVRAHHFVHTQVRMMFHGINLNLSSTNPDFIFPIQEKNFQCKICKRYFIFKNNCRVHVRCVHRLKADKFKDQVESYIVDLRKSDNKKKGSRDEEDAVAKVEDGNTDAVLLNPTEDPVRKAKREQGKAIEFAHLFKTFKYLEISPDLYRNFDPSKNCEYCVKEFEPEELEQHVKTHEDQEKPYQCPYEDCTNVYLKRQHLQNHYYQHVAEVVYQCQKCIKFFYNKAELKVMIVNPDFTKSRIWLNRFISLFGIRTIK